MQLESPVPIAVKTVFFFFNINKSTLVFHVYKSHILYWTNFAEHTISQKGKENKCGPQQLKTTGLKCYPVFLLIAQHPQHLLPIFV